MFAVKNNTSASTLSSSITNKNADAFIQPKVNENSSENNKDVEAEQTSEQSVDQTANQTVSKNKNTSSSFFSPQTTVQKQPEEEIQKQEGNGKETLQDVSEITISEVKTKEASSETTTKNTPKEGNNTTAPKTASGSKNSGGGNTSSKENGNKKEENDVEKEVVELPTENTKIYADALVSQSPIAFAKAVKTSDQDSLTAQTSEQDTLKESLPEIEQPTGIPLKSKAAADKAKQKTAQEENKLKGPQETLSDTAPKGKKEGEKVEEKNVQPPSTLIEKLKAFFGFGRYGSDDDKKSKIKSGIKNLPTSESVDTNPGESPKVDLTGQADPSKNEENTEAADTSVSKDQSKNIEESKIYRGEDDIYPEMDIEMLSPTTELSSIETNSALEKEIPNVSPEVAQSFDASAKAYMDQEIAQEKGKQDEAFAKMEADQAQEHLLSEQKIEKETNRVKKEQETEQQKAKGEVSKQRTDWKKENEAVKNEYSSKSTKERQKVDKDIDTKTKETDKKVDQEYSKAKKEGDKKVNAANKEAKAKKAKAKRDSKKKSWWDRAVDAVSSFFDKLKEALNTLFDGLRKLVKGLIEAAKKLANKLIDLARDAIVGLIKAFGEALKAFVNVALAAFPKLRDKFNAAIDKAVNKAVEVVNKLAEGLKKAVNALLDALGAVLDAILAAYQALYNLLLDVLKFLTVGLLKVLEFLWNLVEGAGYAPGAFFGALAKEAIGGDPSKPLPNFEVPQGQEENWSKAMGLQPGQTNVEEGKQVKEQIPEQLKTVLSKKELASSDVILEPNPAVELSPEILSQFSMIKDGGTMDLGGAGADAITTEEFQASAMDASGYDLNSISDTTSKQVNESVDAAQNIPTPKEDASGSGPDWKNMSDDKKLDHYLAQMLKPNQEAGAKKPAPSTQKAQPVIDNSPAALITKTGRLGAGQRLAFMGKQMLTGIEALWNKYKAWIIAGLVTALLAAGVIAFFTGGAGLAVAVDIIVKAMIVIFGAVAVYKAVGHLWDYVKHAWAGNTKKAGESLALAFAVIIVEFFIDKILLGMAKVFKRIIKGAKAAIKTTKAGRKLFTGAAKVSRFAKTTIRKGISKIKNSKLVVNMQKRIGKGAKKFDDLRNKILDKFGFKRVWAEKHGKWIEIWGDFNPKIMLIREDGTHEFRDIDTLTDIQKGKMRKGNQIGTNFKAKKSEKVIVSDSFEDAFKAMTKEQKKEAIKKLKSSDFKTRRAAGNTSPNKTPEWARGTEWEKYYKKRGDIESSFSGTKNADEEIHHLTTMQNLEHDVVKKAVRDGEFKINDATANGKKVRRYSSETRTKKVGDDDLVSASKEGTHASHPNYTEGQRELLERFKRDYPEELLDGATGQKPAKFIEEMNKKLSSAIDDLSTDQIIDQLFKVKGKYQKTGIHSIDDFYDSIISNL